MGAGASAQTPQARQALNAVSSKPLDGSDLVVLSKEQLIHEVINLRRQAQFYRNQTLAPVKLDLTGMANPTPLGGTRQVMGRWILSIRLEMALSTAS